MCGIAGIYRLGDVSHGERARVEDLERVAAMLQAIEYRGPDDAGLEHLGRAKIGRAHV